ncbi:hypothetical protein EEI76_19225 [Enterobacter cloacae]|nr:hypothetical protein EEI76_19225 [Enterobacter cloacae]
MFRFSALRISGAGSSDVSGSRLANSICWVSVYRLSVVWQATRCGKLGRREQKEERQAQLGGSGVGQFHIRSITDAGTAIKSLPACSVMMNVTSMLLGNHHQL